MEEDEEEEEKEWEKEVEEEMDESTRQYHLWTHQIHVFFKLNFFPATEREITIAKAIECRLKYEKKHEMCLERIRKEKEDTDWPDAQRSIDDEDRSRAATASQGQISSANISLVNQ